ncbi:MAG: sterol desaturase family protein [Natronospirillum sp.]|uniref:sterol desaturase family protein n=1 Tax=Natronospirillum sp. TaxID=2812955 RepID=UPI0025FB45A3|nr:sterol desaturase family protein [Natronospirillum sp.]MCH8552297.1 sterol desaturase family protein [Natronospirillum sp.]
MMTKAVLRYGSWPVLFLGMSAWIIHLAATGHGILPMLGVLALAIGLTFLVEHSIPYQPEWNRPHGDIRRDWLHAVVNLTLNRALLWTLPLFAWMSLSDGVWPAEWPFWAQAVLSVFTWPTEWPFWAQVLFAVLILDMGIAAAHHASHKFHTLWALHAVHHSVKRLYGFNGLMKHPLHQLIETLTGVLPLLLLGVPFEVAITLPFLVSLSLLAQHSNADYRLGPLKFVFAHAETHRFHHTNDKNGNYNYGLFTNLYDLLMGTFHYQKGATPSTSAELGIGGRDDYPKDYRAQLVQPFVDMQNPRPMPDSSTVKTKA